MPNLDAVVKAYDVRGTVPDQLDESLARAFGVAFARFTDAESVAVAHDMRPSGPALVAAFEEGLTSEGVSVVNLGLASTDLLYYASGSMNVPGAMFTASHNPAQYNGIKMCTAGAKSIGIDNGLRELRELARGVLGQAVVGDPSLVTRRNLLADFAKHVLSFVDVSAMRSLKVVADTANGMGGLRRSPGATILYNLISSRAVAEVIAENGGTGQRTKNGHSYMKQVMAETGAVFAGEHSGHYYFADNYRADSGLIAALVVLGEMSRTGLPLSKLREPVERYANSGEINTQVKDIDAVIARVAEKYSRFPQDRLDGLTVDCGDWWFNVRASNTEPLLRLNLEAPTREQCDNEVATLLQLITA
ncbi:MAG: phosphomannomutase/phosphoglucomutase [Actinobacteria bacterium]|nr:phosphomannomutase/phosphoglucomutase [Actinomycetota bacterium]